MTLNCKRFISELLASPILSYLRLDHVAALACEQAFFPQTESLFTGYGRAE